MLNAVGWGICDDDAAVLCERLRHHLGHEKPGDVVVTWLPREERIHNLMDIHASVNCPDHTVRLVALACQEAGLAAQPVRYQPHHSAHPTLRGWGIPGFVEIATRIAGETPINVSASENSRVIDLAGNDAPYVEVIAPWPNGIGAQAANESAQHLAVLFAHQYDVELFATNGMMTFIPRIILPENAPP